MENAVSTSEITMISLANLKPGRFNPRKYFDEKAVSELAESICRQGVLQPIGVRSSDDSGIYEIIYGERRFKASLKAGLTEIPAIVHHVSDEAAQELAVTENLQRKDVSPMEEARAYQNLIQTGRYDVKALSERFGKSENYIRARLSFSSLIPEIAELLDADEITISLANEICHYSEDIQKDVYEKHLKDSRGYCSWRGVKAQEIRSYLQNSYTADLKNYLFDKSACFSCQDNTNNLVLFCDGGCGKCANMDCLEEKNVSFIVEKALDIMSQYPAVVLCHYEYNYNLAAVERLSSMGHELETVAYGLISFPGKPDMPEKADFDTEADYENAYEGFEQELSEYSRTIEEIERRILAGELMRYARIGLYDVSLCYVEIAGENDIKAKEQLTPLAKLEKRDRRNKEIADEKTIEDVRKQIRDVDMVESKFGADEDKMVYFFLMSSLRHEHFKVVGLDESHSAYISDEEKLNVVSNLSTKAKVVIRRDFLVSRFQDRYISDTAKSLLLDFAQKHMPDELANIKKTYYDVYEKRHKRIEERKTALMAAGQSNHNIHEAVDDADDLNESLSGQGKEVA